MHHTHTHRNYIVQCLNVCINQQIAKCFYIMLYRNERDVFAEKRHFVSVSLKYIYFPSLLRSCLCLCVCVYRNRFGCFLYV